ncbi:hypothetical protein [Microvirga splendida]|uniref:Uncharacterized protein n=1 Tax=Microvirga splendida TaxID=2795727 RepID=A0ABS0Y432_9HYPH|nr:hypothetical protein [Microvirga splendida]MBJ6127074.1 hypothetical protein [Microvirga splendida]
MARRKVGAGASLSQVATATALAVPVAVTPMRADVIAKDEGLDEKERWTIGKRYDDLDNAYDASSIIPSEEAPANPSTACQI